MADLSIALAPSPAPVAAPKTDAPTAPRASGADDSQKPEPFAKLMAKAKPAKPQHVAHRADKEAKSDKRAADATDQDKDATTDEKSTSDDPLGDAISAGLTAVLALAQPAAPTPPPPSATEASTTPVKLTLPGLPTIPGLSAAQQATPTPAAMDAAQQALAAFVAANGTSDTGKPDAAAGGETEQPSQAAMPATNGSASKPAQPISSAAIAALAADANGTAPQKIEARAAATLAPLSGKKTGDTPPVVPTAARHPGEPMQPGTQPKRLAHADSRKAGEGAFTIAALGAQSASLSPAVAAVDPALAGAQSPADVALQQQLDVAQDGQWLDRLAKDIAGAAGSGQDLSFRLSPPNLGTLAVSIAQGTDGAAVRLTTDSADTRQLLIDSQPKLVAEARAQGLKISETHVDLNNNQQQSGSNGWGQNSNSSNPHAQGQSAGQQQRSPLPDRQPFSSNPNSQADSDTNGTADSDALYA